MRIGLPILHGRSGTLRRSFPARNLPMAARLSVLLLLFGLLPGVARAIEEPSYAVESALVHKSWTEGEAVSGDVTDEGSDLRLCR
jgi:hypothetical protein